MERIVSDCSECEKNREYATAVWEALNRGGFSCKCCVYCSLPFIAPALRIYTSCLECSKKVKDQEKNFGNGMVSEE